MRNTWLSGVDRECRSADQWTGGGWSVKDPTTGVRVFGRTRWRRFGLVLGPSVGVVVLLFYLIAAGVIAVSFQMSGIPFTLNAANLSGNHFVQYATVDSVTNTNELSQLPAGSYSGSNVADTVTVLGGGTISALTQTVCAGLPTGGKLVVTITAGQSAGNPVTFTGLVANAPLLTATNASFTNINIGQDLQQAMINQGLGNPGPSAIGQFSQAADSVSIDGVKQVALGTSAGSFTLPGLNLGAKFAGGCP